MTDHREVELVIHSADDAEVDAIVDRLKALGARRLGRTRVVDPMSVVVIAGAVLTMVNSLLELRDHLTRRQARDRSPEAGATDIVIVVRNENGTEVHLQHADGGMLQQVVDGTEDMEGAQEGEGGTDGEARNAVAG